MSKRQLYFCRGWNAAVNKFCDGLAELPDDTLTPDQQALRNCVFDFLNDLFPKEGLLKVKPANAQLSWCRATTNKGPP